MNNVEKCVSCNCDTNYKITDDVNFRSNYIEGAGQLCDKCYHDIYDKNLKICDKNGCNCGDKVNDICRFNDEITLMKSI